MPAEAVPTEALAVEPPQTDDANGPPEAPTESPAETTVPLPEAPKMTTPAPIKQSSTPRAPGVSVAIAATVVIVVILAALAVLAFLKQH